MAIAFVFFCSSRRKRKTQRKITMEVEKNGKERKELTFLLLKPCVSRLLEALSYPSSGALLSFGHQVSRK
jgi:hypothetical protein